MVCREPDLAQVRAGKIPPPSVYPKPCEEVPMSVNEYAAKSDRTLLYFWLIIALLAFVYKAIFWFTSESPSNLLSFISRKGKEITRCIKRK